MATNMLDLENEIYISNNSSNPATITLDFSGIALNWFIDGVPYSGNPTTNISHTLPGNESVGIVVESPNTLPGSQGCYISGTPGTPRDTRDVQLMNNGVVQEKVFHVVSTEPISVYAESRQTKSRDAGLILPHSALGSDYFIHTYDAFTPRAICGQQSNSSTSLNDDCYEGPAEIGIVAIESGTVVDIELADTAKSTVDEHVTILPPGTHTITLGMGQAYQVMADGFDLTGTRVRARNEAKIAVFSGNQAIRVPTIAASGNVYAGADHLYEQALPVETWSNAYITTPVQNDSWDAFKVVSGNNSNVISLNGSTIATLNQGEFLEMRNQELFLNGSYTASATLSNFRVKGANLIESTEPISVAQFITSSDVNTIGSSAELRHDPSMIVLTPNDRRITSAIFSTLPEIPFAGGNCGGQTVKMDYLNILCETIDTGAVVLVDAVSGLSPGQITWDSVPGTNFSYGIIQISNNTSAPLPYSLSVPSTSSGFNAYVYGLDCQESYGYAADVSSTPLTAVTGNHLLPRLSRIFPNPAKNLITIDCEGWKKESLSVEVLNLQGQKWIGRSLNGGEQMKLGISDLPAGYYLIRISGEERIETLRFVKQ